MFNLDNTPCNVSRTRRMVAYLLDMYLGGIVMMFPIAFWWMRKTHDIDAIPTLNILKVADNLGEQTAIILGIVAIIVGLTYYVILPMLTNGQTIGKKIMRFKIVNVNGQEPSHGQIIIRQFIGIILLAAILYPVSGMIRTTFSLATNINITGFGMWLGLIITIISIVLLFMSNSCRMLHDYLAKTKVEMINKE